MNQAFQLPVFKAPRAVIFAVHDQAKWVDQQPRDGRLEHRHLTTLPMNKTSAVAKNEQLVRFILEAAEVNRQAPLVSDRKRDLARVRLVRVDEPRAAGARGWTWR